MSLLANGLGGALASRWDALRGSYWFVPTMMVVVAALVAVGLIEVDQRMVRAELIRLPWIHDTGAEGTRALLSTVAGSMITVTGVVFSITIVALTLASSQFGPRLLRGFLRDRSTQWVLGTFVSTFLYSLLVLRAVEAGRVPYLATTVALGLAVASVFVLIFFVHHAASSIQASSVIAAVVAEIEAELPVLFPESLGEAGESAVSPGPARPALSDARIVRAHTSGYVRVLDAGPVFAIAREDDLVVELLARPGDFVTEGQAIARVWPSTRDGDQPAGNEDGTPIDRPEGDAEDGGGEGGDEGGEDGIDGCLAEVFVVGTHRTAVQDLGFLTDQLAEMAVRALSPGTSDPNTAVACVNRLGAVLAQVANRVMPAAERLDDDGRLRVIARATRFSDVVESCLDPIRRYGVDDAQVVAAVLSALEHTCSTCREPTRRALLLAHAREWFAGFSDRARASKRDRRMVEERLAGVEAAAAVGEVRVG